MLSNVAQTGYAPGAPGGTTLPAVSKPNVDYWSLDKLRRAYTDFRWSKRDEIEEQKNSRRYYHGSQWTDTQIKALKKRRQPVMTFNRISRKIDGVVGLIERMRQDPKGFPRTPQHEEGAELTTAVLRYVLDQGEWAAKSPEIALNGAVDGVSGLEVDLQRGDLGDMDINFEIVEPDSFFYDPRSFRKDMSDARYMGTSKWVDIDQAKEMFPEKGDELDASVELDTDMTNDSDREAKWIFSDGTGKKVRIVDTWYRHKGGWCYAVHTGSVILMEGASYLQDEKGKTQCKYIMFRSNVDHDGDAYGFVRNMQSAQDGINAKQSKMQHILASRRLIMTAGAVTDVEKTRAEWARPDGVVVANPGGEVKPDDQSFDFAGWSKMLELNLAEIENFGPNPALIGQGIENKSGRAIGLLQQAGIAELGPYIINFKGWKLRVYRALWNAVQRHWTAERWIRVTDDQAVEQFIKINGLGVDPNTGMPTIINAVGSLDVDIIIDEGPDQINMMADSYDTLTALAAKGANVPPRVLIELAPLTYSVKKKITDLMDKAEQQPNPEVQAKQAELQMKQQDMQMSAQMKAQEAQAGLQLKATEAQQNAALEQQKAEQQMELKRLELAANIENKRIELQADIALEREKADNQMMLAGQKAQHDAKIKSQHAADGEPGTGEEQAKSKDHEMPDHMPALISALDKLGNRPTPRGVKRTKDGMELVFD